jgi:hypothetical protein
MRERRGQVSHRTESHGELPIGFKLKLFWFKQTSASSSANKRGEGTRTSDVYMQWTECVQKQLTKSICMASP